MDLIYGWGNEGFSAKEGFLLGCLNQALASDGPILECGSGLTTITLGMIAQRYGKSIWTLEDNPMWGERVEIYLKKCRIDSVRLCVRPLKNYGDFFWYDPPLGSMPERFTMVVCDGPTEHAPGGRYGLLPVMRARFGPGTVILLDDVSREQEKTIAARWTSESNIGCEVLGSRNGYGRIVIPSSEEQH